MWVTGAQPLGSSAAAFQAHWQGNRLEVEQLELELVPIKDANIAGSGFSLCVTTSAPSNEFLMGKSICLEFAFKYSSQAQH